MKTIIRKRAFSLLLAFVMICSLLPTTALAAESDENGTTVCTLNEGCTLVAGHEGDCITEEPTTEDTLAKMIAALPDPADIDPEDEAQAQAVDKQLKDIYAYAAENDIDVEDNDTINAVIAALYPTEALAEGDTYTLTLDYTSSEYYDKDKISSIAVKSIGGKPVSLASSYQISVGNDVVIEVTYADTATNYMAAISFQEAGETEFGLLETTKDEDGKACKTFYYAPEEAKDVTISLAGLTSWSVDGTTLTISGSGCMPNFAWESPASADALHSIYGPYYDAYRSSITSVTVSEGITHTANWAFMNFTSLTDISLPDSLTSIGWYLIRNCTQVTSITIPESVTLIQGGAFSGASSLKKIQTGTNAVDDGTFDIRNVETLGINVFGGTSVEKIALPDGMTTIPTMLFYNCSNLKTITIPASVTTVESNAFSGCGQAMTVYFGGTKAQWDALDIGSSGNGNYNLKRSNNTIYFYSEQDPTLSEDFDPTLKYWHEGNAGTPELWTVYYATLMSQGAIHGYVYGAQNSQVELPDLSGENVVGQKTFVGWYSDEGLSTAVDENDLTSPTVTLSNETATYYAKWETAKYTIVYMLNGGKIGEAADPVAETVEYGERADNKTASKENYMFGGWYSDYALTVSYDFTTPITGNVVLYAKWENPHGTWGNNIAWELDPETGVLSFTGTGAMKNDYTSGRALYPWSGYHNGVRSIVIGEGITNVPYQAFDGKLQKLYYQNVEKITLPSTLTVIKQGSFRGLSKLQTINSSVNGVFDLRDTAITEIEGAVFNNAANLKIALFPDTFTKVGQQAFESCSNLVAVQFPKNVSGFVDASGKGQNVFVGCNDFKIIYLLGDSTAWDPTLDNSSTNSDFRIKNAVKAYLNGGSLPDTISVDNLSSSLLTPVQADRAFDGWYSSTTPGDGSSSVTKVPSTSGAVIYANWTDCTHNLSYDAAGSSITETCANCGHEVKATLSAPENLVYDNSSKTVALVYTTDKGNWLGSQLTIKYYKSDEEVKDSPVAAGTYTAKITAGTGGVSVTASVEFTIEPRSITIPAEDTTVFTYNGEEQTYSVATSNDYTVSGHNRTDAGSQTVTVKLKDKINTKWSNNSTDDVTFTFEIAKATPVISIAADKESFKGSGTVKLTVTGTPTTGGTVTVTCGENTYTPSLENGKYVVTVDLPNETKDYDFTASYTAAENGNYENAQSNACKVSVARRSSGGGSSSDPTYSVSTPGKTENGSVTVSPKNASKGDRVTVTVKPDSGYTLETLTVIDSKGKEIQLTDKGEGKYTFTMPAGKVEVKATFMDDNTMLNFFVDVKSGDYYYDAVLWAAKNGITSGTDAVHFSPEQPCTRAQIVTFLWRAAGAPEPKETAASLTDVVSGSYYEKAVAWAIENGITTGTGDGEFSPDDTCTRAQAVTFLARALNAKAASAAEFSDVPTDSYFADAVAWAAANGVTEGIGGGLFGSDNDCTRGQIVTFLYRAYNK